MYQVHYNGIAVNESSSNNTSTFTAPSLPDGVFTGTVDVMVTAVNRFGIGPASDPATAEIRGNQYVHNSVYILTFTYTLWDQIVLAIFCCNIARGFPLSEVKNVLVTPVGTKIIVLIMEVFSIVSLIWRIC